MRQNASYFRDYRATHRDQINANQRAHYARNREALIAKKIAWNKKNREQINARERVRYANNPEESRAKSLAYHYAHQEESKAKSIAYYYNNQEERQLKSREYHYAHKEKRNANSRNYNATHKEERDQHTKEYRKKNPHIKIDAAKKRRALKAGSSLNDLTSQQWAEIKIAYNHRCVYCRRKMQRLTQDHLTPLSKGGNHTVANIVPACHSCNSRKNAGAPLVPVQPLLLTIAPSSAKRGYEKKM